MTAINQIHGTDCHRQRWVELGKYNGKTCHTLWGFASPVSFYLKKDLKQVKTKMLSIIVSE